MVAAVPSYTVAVQLVTAVPRDTVAVQLVTAVPSDTVAVLLVTAVPRDTVAVLLAITVPRDTVAVLLVPAIYRVDPLHRVQHVQVNRSPAVKHSRCHGCNTMVLHCWYIKQPTIAVCMKAHLGEGERGRVGGV